MEYVPPVFLFNAHLETIYPSLFRRVDFVHTVRENIITPDNDFLEISVHKKYADKLVIISHGLEGDMDRPYIRGMARACHLAGFDVLAWNYRGCGLTMNTQLRFYHSGATDDLHTVINFAAQTLRYAEINLIGFSLGGNITLKYLGEKRERPSSLKKAVTISVPLDLKTSCEKISLPANSLYSNRFLRSLKNKIITKSKLMDGIDNRGIDRIRTLKDFDDRYTAPLHGFKNAEEYYHLCSSIHFIHAIQNPSLILSAKNDPFLSPQCYPFKEVKDHPFVTFETPTHGGHVGFTSLGNNGIYWSEKKTVEFLTSKSDGE